jgi:TolA-binding protein
MGESLASMGRHDEAVGAFAGALAEMDMRGEPSIARKAPLRATLMVLTDRTRRDGDLDAAVQYGDLALQLTDRGEVELATTILGQIGDLLAGYSQQLREKAADAAATDAIRAERFATAARLHARRAAELFLELARINSLDPLRTAEALWRAADLYDLAGHLTNAERLFEQYSAEFADEAFAARAWSRIGSIRQRMGRFEQAIAAYRTGHTRYPRTLDGARALLPLAECHRIVGELDEAERVLRLVIADPVVFTPRAPEFAEAMYRLGDLLNQKSQYEQSITVLEEWWDRYAEDSAYPSERPRALYLLADSYRHSGLALQAEAEGAAFSGQREQMLDDARARLQKAREHYGSLAELCRRGEAAGDPHLTEMYLRHAVLYEADCLFEMGMHRDALRLYEEAAGAWSDSTVALAAFVQIITCHLSLGSQHEARASLARAEVLVDRVPDAAFESSLSPERRDDWRRFFAWLGQSELFAAAGS